MKLRVESCHRMSKQIISKILAFIIFFIYTLIHCSNPKRQKSISITYFLIQLNLQIFTYHLNSMHWGTLHIFYEIYLIFKLQNANKIMHLISRNHEWTSKHQQEFHLFFFTNNFPNFQISILLAFLLSVQYHFLYILCTLLYLQYKNC